MKNCRLLDLVRTPFVSSYMAYHMPYRNQFQLGSEFLLSLFSNVNYFEKKFDNGWYMHYEYLPIAFHTISAFIFALGIRNACREAYNISGNLYEDFFSCLLLYPMAAVQIDEQIALGVLPKDLQDPRVDVVIRNEHNGPPSYSIAMDDEKRSASPENTRF